jgi:murein DD-endopeptidase MepM/ murein hydrolase activator NlpD
LLAAFAATMLLFAACGDGDAPASPTATPATATRSATPSASATPTPVPPTATPTARPAAPAPIGFPIDPETTLGFVTGEVGSRALQFTGGPSALAYSREEQPSADPAIANRAGWNCRVHVEYEDLPAVDWYLPEGTAILATMDGVATLLINTISNPFDVYGVSREPYIGNPDRARAPVSPFPGPGGGQGVFVRVDNGTYRTDYAHLDLGRTMLAAVPATAWFPGYGPGPAIIDQFTPLRDFRVATAVAQWEVKAGDVIGFSGDSGYSEGPHLHYTVQSGGAYLCPTSEAGFQNGGWLLR